MDKAVAVTMTSGITLRAIEFLQYILKSVLSTAQLTYHPVKTNYNQKRHNYNTNSVLLKKTRKIFFATVYL